MVAGVVIMISGIAGIVKYFRMNAREAVVSQSLMRGLASLLVGGFCAFRSGWFIATFPVLTMIYGVIILLNGLNKVQTAVDMLRLKNRSWFWAAINAAVSVVCAIVVLNTPFASTTVLWVFTGVTLIAEAVIDAITMILGRAK